MTCTFSAAAGHHLIASIKSSTSNQTVQASNKTRVCRASKSAITNARRLQWECWRCWWRPSGLSSLPCELPSKRPSLRCRDLKCRLFSFQRKAGHAKTEREEGRILSGRLLNTWWHLLLPSEGIPSFYSATVKKKLGKKYTKHELEKAIGFHGACSLLGASWSKPWRPKAHTAPLPRQQAPRERTDKRRCHDMKNK